MSGKNQTRRSVVRNISAAAVGLAGISGTVAANESAEEETEIGLAASTLAASTKDYAITFRTDPSDGSLDYEVTVPDENAELENIETGFFGNDDVSRTGGQTTVEGTVKGEDPYYDKIHFDSDDGTPDEWDADSGLQVELYGPDDEEILQRG